ncbi:MAG TPA: hypothetical protein VFJ29_02280 [Candidatus Kapabacteria bacterium]|nr:hypothetical protein [Candidatus Kapabacteria bacterium]
MKYSLLIFVFAAAAFATTQRSEWVIKDTRLRGQVISAMKEYLFFVQKDTAAALTLSDRGKDADLIVAALENSEDNTRQLIGIQYDSLHFSSTERVRALLGEALYDFIAERSGYEYDINLTTTEQRLSDVLWWVPQRTLFGLDHQMIKISPSFGFTNEIGNSTVQMPWWEYGMFRAGVVHSYFKFLFQGPFAPGLQRIWFVDKRHLDGAFGGAFEFNVENWGGEIAYATMSKQTSLYNTYIRPPYVNYISFIGQLTYSLDEPLGSIGALRITFGGGMHVIKHDSIDATSDHFARDASEPSATIVSPILKIAYVSENDNVEFSTQFYNTSLLFTCSTHIVGAFWMSGSGLMIRGLRTPESYEPDYFVFITPELRW